MNQDNFIELHELGSGAIVTVNARHIRLLRLHMEGTIIYFDREHTLIVTDSLDTVRTKLKGQG